MHQTSVQMHLARGCPWQVYEVYILKFFKHYASLCQEGVKTCQRARWKWKILWCMHPAQNSLLEANQSQARYWSGWLWPWRRKKGVSNQQTNNKHAIYCNHDQQKIISSYTIGRKEDKYFQCRNLSNWWLLTEGPYINLSLKHQHIMKWILGTGLGQPQYYHGRIAMVRSPSEAPNFRP